MSHTSRLSAGGGGSISAAADANDDDEDIDDANDDVMGDNGSDGGADADLDGDSSSMSAAVQGLRSTIMQQEGHEPTNNEYIMYIFKLLGSGAEVGGGQLADLLKFFGEVIPKASSGIVKAVYKDTADKLLQVARSCRDDDASHAKVLKHALISLGALLMHFGASESVWESLQGMSTINAFMLFVEVPNESIRKVCKANLCEILKAHKKSTKHVVADHISSHILDVFRGCSRSEYKRSLFLIEFLHKGLSLMPGKTTISIIESAIRLHSCEQHNLSANVYSMFDHYFQSMNSSLDLSNTKQVLSYLVGQRPLTPDMEANCHYYNSTASCMIYLYKLSKAEGQALVPGVVASIVSGFETEFAQIHNASLNSIRRIISGCVNADDLAQAMASSNPSASYVGKIIESLDDVLQMRYQQSWVNSLECFRYMYQGFNQDQNRVLLSKYLEKTSDLYHVIELGSIVLTPAVKNKIQDVLGCAIAAFGPESFLEAVPMLGPEDPPFVGVNDSREWVLVLLQSYLKDAPCTLSNFGNTALKYAQQCSAAIKSPESVGIDSSNMTEPQVRRLKIVGNRVVQFWSLFPLYCANCPPDIATCFPQILPLLEEVMADATFPEVRIAVARAISTLIKSCKNKYDIAAGTNLSAAKLPADLAAIQTSMVLFVQHLLRDLDATDITNGNFRPIVEDLAEMISISPPDLVGQVATLLLTNLLESTEMTDEMIRRAASWMTTLLAIVNFLPQQVITIFHRTIAPFMDPTKVAVLQKRGYKIMDTLVQTHPETIFSHEPRDALIASAKASVLTCHVSVRGARLTLLKTLVCSITDVTELSTEVNNLMTEILVSIKDANQKPRDAATELLKYLIENTPSSVVFGRVVPHLNSEHASERSAALMALCLQMKLRRDDVDLLAEVTKMLPSVTSLLHDASGNLSTPEQVRAVLSFLQVSSQVLPLANLQATLTNIVGAITRGLGTEQGNYTQFCRSIYRKLLRKVNEEAIRVLIPEAEQNLLKHILRMNRRSERKKVAEAKKDRMEQYIESDESDDDNMTIAGAVAAGGGSSAGGRVGGGSAASRRPKAVRVQDFNLELSEDILGDGISDILSAAVGGSKGKRGGGAAKDADSDDDDDFEMVENEQGIFVIKERSSKMKRSREEEEEEEENKVVEPQGMNQGVSFNGAKDRKTMPERKRVAPGAEYKSRKAGGDVWKKGMLEPHAFIPLDPRLLTAKKSRDKGIALMSQIISHGTGSAAGVGGGKGVRGQTAGKKQRESQRRKGKS